LTGVSTTGQEILMNTKLTERTRVIDLLAGHPGAPRSGAADWPPTREVPPRQVDWTWRSDPEESVPISAPHSEASLRGAVLRALVWASLHYWG
jgi:hypothetical protein